MASLVKVVYEELDSRDDQPHHRAITGYRIDCPDDHFVQIKRESDGRRFLINRTAIVKIETLREA